MTKRQTKFGRRDVNDPQRKPNRSVAVISNRAADKLASPLAAAPKTIG
jgi:hypothetical protein